MLLGASFLAHAPLACARVANLPIEGTPEERVFAAERALSLTRWHDEACVVEWVVSEPFHAAIALATLADRPHSLVGERVAEVLPELAALAIPEHAATHEHELSHDTRPTPLLDHVSRALSFAMEESAQLTSPWRALLTTVLLFADVAKGGDASMREGWRARLGVDGTLHNQDSAAILQEVVERVLSSALPFALDPTWARRAIALVQATGLTGMRLRGEVERDALAEIVGFIDADKNTGEVRALLSLVNRCDTAAVRWGLWTDELAACFSAEENSLFAHDKVLASTPLPERLLRLRGGPLFDPAALPALEIALDSLGAEGRALLTKRLATCRIWYAEAALAPLSLASSVRLLSLLCGSAASSVDVTEVWHLDLLQVVSHLRESSGAARPYVVRLLEALLDAATPEALSRGELAPASASARALLSFPSRRGRQAALIVRMEEVDEAKALLTLLPIYEKKEAATFHRTLKSLCDLYGLRKDDFDRVANESSYLKTMNAAKSDKARLVSLAREGTIVEVGPGGGVVLDLLSEQYPAPSSRIIGLDASRAVIDALERRRDEEKRQWSVVHGDAFELSRIFGKESVDTVVFCSVLHEIYSYVTWPPQTGARFQLESVDAIVVAAFRALNVGGRILIRDGVMPSDEPRIVEFVDPEWESGFALFARAYEPRRIPFERSGEHRITLSQRDLYEFVTTYTWGPSAFPYEIREQRAVLPRAEYIARLVAVCSTDDPQFLARELPVDPSLATYLSPGYPAGIAGHLRIFDGAGTQEVALPPITGVLALEKLRATHLRPVDERSFPSLPRASG